MEGLNMIKKIGLVLFSLFLIISVFAGGGTSASAAERGSVYVKNSPSSDSWIQLCYDGARCKKLNPGQAMYTNYWAPTVGKSFDFDKVTVTRVGAGSWKQRWNVAPEGYGGCHALSSNRTATLQVPVTDAIDIARVDYLLYDRTRCRH